MVIGNYNDMEGSFAISPLVRHSSFAFLATGSQKLGFYGPHSMNNLIA